MQRQWMFSRVYNGSVFAVSSRQQHSSICNTHNVIRYMQCYSCSNVCKLVSTNGVLLDMISLNSPFVSVDRRKSMRNSKCRLTTCSLLSLLLIVLIYIALIDKASNGFRSSPFAHRIVRRTEAEEQPQHHRHLTTTVIIGKNRKADEYDAEYFGNADDTGIFLGDRTNSRDEGTVVAEHGVATRPVSRPRLQKRQERTDDYSYAEEADVTSELNSTLSTTTDVADNATIHVGGTETNGTGQNSSSKTSFKVPTDSTDATYLKIFKSLEKLLGFNIDDNQLKQQLQPPTVETNFTNTTTSITSEMNVTVATPISDGESTTTVQLTQPSNQTSRPSLWQTTSDRRLWWNTSCWRSSAMELHVERYGNCDADRLEGLRDRIFDTAALSRLGELCQPGEWCLQDRIEFGRLTASEEIRQLCNASDECITRLQSSEQQCDVSRTVYTRRQLFLVHETASSTCSNEMFKLNCA